MTTAIKRRRGTTAQHSTFTGLEGEITVDTTKDTLVVHDGATAGGFALLREDLSNNTNVASTSTTQTFTNKTINLSSNTLTGTTAQFNTALSDGDFATLAGTETLSNKTFSTNPTISSGTANGVVYLNGSKVLTSGSSLTFDGTNLGVGTSSPSTYGKLAVSGNAAILSGNGTYYYNSANDAWSFIKNTGATGVGELAFNLYGSEQMRLTSTGLGIGTSSPGAKLHVAGAISEQIRVDGLSGFNSSVNFCLNNSAKWAAQVVGDGTNAFRLYNFVAGSEAMRLDSSGNLGLGVTPSAWGSAYRTALQVQYAGLSGSSGAPAYASLSANTYLDSTATYKYIAAAYASRFEQTDGQHRWYTAPSGTAGNAISFTQAMTLDASGRLGIGTGTPLQALDVRGRTGLYGSSDAYQLKLSYAAGTAGFWMGSPSDNALAFYNDAGTERMRIDSSGNLLVGRTGQINQERFGYTTTTDVGAISNRASTTAYYPWIFQSNSGTVGYIYSTTSSTTYATSSDYRLKENIQPMQGALATVAQLNPVTYTWKADGSDGQGFIAHELQAVVPDCVTGEKDAVDAEGKPVYQGIDTSFLVATLTKAIQEQQEQINQLKAEVAALKGN